MLDKNRKSWIDYVKFFSMMLVIFYHTPPRLETLDEVIVFNLRMPVFFCMSGFLFNIGKYNTFGKYVKRRIKQIIVPYVVFFAVFYPLWLLAGRALMGEQAIYALTPLYEFVTGQPNVVVATFWYLACLFTMQLIYYWLRRWLPGLWPLVASVAMSLALHITPDTPLLGWWNLDQALRFMPLYAFGDVARGYIDRVRFDGWRQSLTIVALAVAGVAGLLWLRHNVSAEWWYLLQVETALLLLPLVLATFKAVASHLPPSQTVQNVVITGTIYLGLQNYFIGAIKILLAHLCGPAVFDEHVWLKAVVALVVLVAIYPVAVFINRHAPWVLGKGPLFDRL